MAPDRVDHEKRGPPKDQFYKTKLCIPFASGQCKRGKNCCFAHGDEELRSPLNLVKTKICEAWVQGKCFAPQCNYAHGEDELRATSDYYKTGLCKFWKRGLPCEAGSECRHAHGQEELRLRNYRRTERDKRESKSSKAGSTDGSKCSWTPSTSPVSGGERDGYAYERDPKLWNATNDQAMNDLEAVVDELLVETEGFSKCHSVSSPALALAGAAGAQCIPQVYSMNLSVPRWANKLGSDTTLTDMLSNGGSAGNMLLGQGGSSMGLVNPKPSLSAAASTSALGITTPTTNLTVEALLSQVKTPEPATVPYAHTQVDRSHKKPPLYIITENNPEFDAARAVTVIIDDEYIKCNVEEVQLLRAPISSPGLQSDSYKLADLIQMLKN